MSGRSGSGRRVARWRPRPRHAGRRPAGPGGARSRPQPAAASLAGGQRQSLCLTRAGQRVLLGLQQRVHAGERSRPGGGSGGLLQIDRLELGQAALGVVGGFLGGLGQLDQRLLLTLGSPQEGDLVQKIVEALRLEHDADQIGPVALVGAHELAREQHLGPRQPRPQQGDQALLANEQDPDPGQRRPITRQVGPHRGLARPDQRDLPVERGDRPREAADARAQLVLARLLVAELGVQRTQARVGARRRRDQDDGSRDHGEHCDAEPEAGCTAERGQFMVRLRG